MQRAASTTTRTCWHGGHSPAWHGSGQACPHASRRPHAALQLKALRPQRCFSTTLPQWQAASTRRGQGGQGPGWHSSRHACWHLPGSGLRGIAASAALAKQQRAQQLCERRSRRKLCTAAAAAAATRQQQQSTRAAPAAATLHSGARPRTCRTARRTSALPARGPTQAPPACRRSRCRSTAAAPACSSRGTWGSPIRGRQQLLPRRRRWLHGWPCRRPCPAGCVPTPAGGLRVAWLCGCMAAGVRDGSWGCAHAAGAARMQLPTPRRAAAHLDAGQVEEREARAAALPHGLCGLDVAEADEAGGVVALG